MANDCMCSGARRRSPESASDPRLARGAAHCRVRAGTRPRTVAAAEPVRSRRLADSGITADLRSSYRANTDGYLWVGTQEGLARFDGFGSRCSTPATNRHPPEQYISVCSSIEAGRMWIGTRSRCRRTREWTLHAVQQIDRARLRARHHRRRAGRLWWERRTALFESAGASAHSFDASSGLKIVASERYTKTRRVLWVARGRACCASTAGTSTPWPLGREDGRAGYGDTRGHTRPLWMGTEPARCIAYGDHRCRG